MEKLLLQQAKLIGLDLPMAGSKLPFGAVYAVGDNPASDIAGARAAGGVSETFRRCSHAMGCSLYVINVCEPQDAVSSALVQCAPFSILINGQCHFSSLMTA